MVQEVLDQNSHGSAGNWACSKPVHSTIYAIPNSRVGDRESGETAWSLEVSGSTGRVAEIHAASVRVPGSTLCRALVTGERPAHPDRRRDVLQEQGS